jgi:hypothetical protein
MIYLPLFKLVYRCWWVYVFMIVLHSSCAAAPGNLDCIKEIELPRYSFIARRSPGGTVKAVVRIGPHGKATIVTTPNADKDLSEEVRDTLTDGTSYLESCNGQELELVFTFRIEGPAVEYPMTTIRFHPPNHFIIVSERKKPHILYKNDLPK